MTIDDPVPCDHFVLDFQVRAEGCWWVGGVVYGMINKPLHGPSCKLSLARISAGLNFSDRPSVAISLIYLRLASNQTIPLCSVDENYILYLD